jgi:phenylacetate-CoA ligase
VDLTTMVRDADDGPFFDELETRSADAREQALIDAVAALARDARANTAYYATALAGANLDAFSSRGDLARLPLLRKSDLAAIQRARAPFGGLTPSTLRPAHIFSSPGGIYEPDTPRRDYWRLARALWATGLRPGHLVHNCFAYHFTPAGMMMESSARAIGASVFPAGTGHTEQQAQAVSVLRPDCYTGTPDYLKAILERGDELALDTSSLRLAHVSGGPLTPPLRQFYDARGINVRQSLATADCGLIAYETIANDGLVIDERVVVEVVQPGTGTPVADGEIGELVVTVLNPDYPLIRFATGDLTAIMPGLSACGRTNQRIKGWLGRADQSVKVRGMFVHPEQVRDIARRHPEIGRARLVVTQREGVDVMTLHVEHAAGSAPEAGAVEASIQAVTKLKGGVTLAAPGTLADDGKLIDDARR